MLQHFVEESADANPPVIPPRDVQRQHVRPDVQRMLLASIQRTKDQMDGSFRALDEKARNLLALDVAILGLLFGLHTASVTSKGVDGLRAFQGLALLGSFGSFLASAGIILVSYYPRDAFLDVAPDLLRRLVAENSPPEEVGHNILVSSAQSASGAFVRFGEKHRLVEAGTRAMFLGLAFLAVMMLGILSETYFPGVIP